MQIKMSCSKKVSRWPVILTAILLVNTLPGCALLDALGSGTRETDSGGDVAEKDINDTSDVRSDTGSDDARDASPHDADARDAFDDDADVYSSRCDEDCGSGACSPIDDECTFPTELTVGDNHACALFEDGLLRCWGDNQKEQLGRTTLGDFSSIPRIVHHNGALLKPDIISAGGQHTCAVVPASLGRGPDTLYCWGNNARGQLGRGSAGDSFSTPAPIDTGGGPNLDDLVAIAAGAMHTCAVFEFPGDEIFVKKVTCWGDNRVNQLANVSCHTDSDGNLFEYKARPVCVVQLASGNDLTKIESLSTHADHTCTIDEANTLRCWGLNVDHQLGRDTADSAGGGSQALADEPSWDSVQFPDSDQPTTLAAATGQKHTCALVSSTEQDTSLYCWGDNEFGQTNPTSTSTKLVAPIYVLSAFAGQSTLVTAGDAFTCINQDDESSIRCFGRNNRGQIGTPQTMPRHLGQPITMASGSELNNVNAIEAGATHACALRENDNNQKNEVWCWGNNEAGQLGVARDEIANDCSPDGYCSRAAYRVDFSR